LDLFLNCIPTDDVRGHRRRPVQRNQLHRLPGEIHERPRDRGYHHDWRDRRPGRGGRSGVVARARGPKQACRELHCGHNSPSRWVWASCVIVRFNVWVNLLLLRRLMFGAYPVQIFASFDAVEFVLRLPATFEAAYEPVRLILILQNYYFTFKAAFLSILSVNRSLKTFGLQTSFYTVVVKGEKATFKVC
jgi:hypothetical protein